MKFFQKYQISHTILEMFPLGAVVIEMRPMVRKEAESVINKIEIFHEKWNFHIAHIT